ncbi:choice-of-anchor I family protein [Chryseobacterium sp.]|uniref:choice-of-anchor I family protein n=1 Tax=Chryseobacterium sp. TaxID=1871047 RepID=UPI0025C00C1E|nr:choice-of-anchor I family protein [Chryseobacterium sp.]
MINNYLFKGAVIAALFLQYEVSGQSSLIHYWNFNNNASETSITSPTSSLISGSLTALAGGTSVIDFAGGTGQNFSSQNLNARNGDPSGAHLRFNNPIGGSLQFSLPTTGYNNVIVKFATRRSGSGAGTQFWSYSTDGINFIPYQTISPQDADPQLVSFDFSSISGVSNNSNFKLKVEFSTGSGGNVGNNRFDNFTVDATPMGTAPATVISWEKNFIKVNEGAGSLNFVINVSNPANSTVDLIVKPAPYSTADSNDFTLANQTIQINPSATSYTVNIPITDDTIAEQQAEYFVVSLENPVGATISGNNSSTIYIVDNDKPAPVPSHQIQLNYIGSFDPSGSNNSSTEIAVHDPASQKLFTISSLTEVFDIIDFSNPATPVVTKTVNMASYGGITSIAVKNGIIVVSSPNADPQQNGSVVFFDINGNFLKQLNVGALPDMITFTPDGTKVLTANEGEPNDAYTIDPEGSVSIIDISGGISNLTQNNVTTLNFNNFDSQESALMVTGLRKVKSTSTLSQDLEPEYITVSSDNQKAWVTLQENNAIAEINLVTKTITDIWGLGKKDMSQPGNGFDASDNNNEILIANWPVKTYYTPDAVQNYKVGNTHYIVTANEGDEKDLSGFSERTTVGANGYNLDPTLFPHSSVLKESYNLGRFRVTSVNGDTDNDSQFEEINALGARSFSIFNADTKQIVYDSGDQFERYIAAHHADLFNADNESNTPKSRSRAKGPEPEGVALATISGQTFAFITLERTGGVMVYNITDPNNVTFTDYKNPRSTSAYGGDNGPEGIIYIAPENTTTGKGYIIVANEISGTLSMYEVAQSATLGNNEVKTEKATFNVFPNPVNKGNILYFNRVQVYELYDMSGKFIKKEKVALTIDTSGLSTGVYLIKTSENGVKRVMVK